MQTLIPPPVTATARTSGRFGRTLGFGLTPRALLFLLAGTLLSIPAFYQLHRIWIMFAWDIFILALIVFDLTRLPSPDKLSITRRFVHSPALGEPTEIVHEVLQQSNARIQVRVTDDLHPALTASPATVTILAYPRTTPAIASQIVYPNRRGDFRLGKVFLRYRGTLRLVDRWAVANVEQSIRIFPATEQSSGNTSIYPHAALARSSCRKRRLRLRGNV